VLAEIVTATWVGIVATTLVLPVAVGLGWLLARRRLPAWLEVVAWLPVVLPPGAFAASGPGGQVLAAALLALPLCTLVCQGAFLRVGARWGHVATALGDTPRERFSRVDLPLAMPGLLAAAALGFARAATVAAAGGLVLAIPALIVFGSLRHAHDEALEAADG